MRIGEVAKRTGLNISNIRFYERKGLLCPDREDNGKYRDYTDEDVIRIKKILLYRKMGISIEIIYLLLNGQAQLEEVLQRQQKLLQEEISDLKGSLKLCSMLLEKGDEDESEEELDSYLNYVYREEERGIKFAHPEELLEDMAAYTGDVLLYGDPVACWWYSHPIAARVISVIFWCGAVIYPVINIIEARINGTYPNPIILAVYLVIVAAYICSFFRFRRKKAPETIRKSDHIPDAGK